MLIDTIVLLFFAASGLILYKLMLKKESLHVNRPVGFNFFLRLILAMDPKYGEISRAMHNRGVEIFMLGEVR